MLFGPPGSIRAIYVDAINAAGRVFIVSNYVRPVSAYWRSAASSEALELDDSQDITMGVIGEV